LNALSKTIFPLLILSLGFCLLATVLGLFGSHHWFLALFANLPLQLAAILIVIAAVLLLTKHQRLALATLLVLLPNLWQLSYYYWPRPYSDQSPSLRVLSFNVRKSNPNHDKVLRHIQSTNADIIALIEVNDHWLKDFSALEETHPYIAHFPNNHNFGLALYSRYPVIKHRRPMPTRGHPLLLAEIDYDGFLLTAVVAHPIPPMNQSGAEFFERYLTSSVNLVAELEGPVLFMGDFNASPWSHLFPSISQKTGLQDSGRGRGFQSTWNRWNPLLTTPIDHVFHSAELQPTARSIGPANGSDHSPILLDFAFHPTLPTPKPAPPNKNTTTPRPNKNTPTKPRLRRVPQSN
jgi:endonuclease/exonuclease/phosphatase (EEP) superfamily protein YafD